MGGLSRGAAWWWNYFKELFFNVNVILRGEIVLSFGQHELNITIDPGVVPTEIYVNCSDEEMPVCVGAASLVSAHLMPDNTFNLYADIKSNSCNVKWIVEYNPVIE